MNIPNRWYRVGVRSLASLGITFAIATLSPAAVAEPVTTEATLSEDPSPVTEFALAAPADVLDTFPGANPEDSTPTMDSPVTELLPLPPEPIFYFFSSGAETTMFTFDANLVLTASPTPTLTPIPPTLALVGIGIVGIAFQRRYRRALIDT